MEVICKPVGPVQANCYIVKQGENALVIDPGDDARALLQLIHVLQLKVDGILLTHAHFDHIGAVDEIARDTGADVYINPVELDFLKDPDKNSSRSFGLPPVSIEAPAKSLKEGLNVIGSFDVRAYYAPGHSAGSTILEIGNNLFTGDVLFQNSIGRTDLATGSVKDMRESLEFLKSLKKDYTVYPGHGESTTLDWEKKHNPYLIYNLL